MPSKSNLCLLTFIIMLCLTGFSQQLDLFFFSKYYNDGQCKPTDELKKYILKNKSEQFTYDTLQEMLVMGQENSIVTFGAYLTSSNKTELQHAHSFFANVYTTMSDTEKVYFPDMVTCFTHVPWISLFGYRDTYGMMYKLVPSLEENRQEDISGNDYNLEDIVDLYLDIFKAMKIVIKNNYYVKDITEDDIGVVMDTEDVNTHIRGKLRHMHNLRSSSSNCKPQNMKSYPSLLDKTIKNKVNPEDVSILKLDTAAPCQVVNLYDTWYLFVKSITDYFNKHQKSTFMFDNCIEDYVTKDNCPDDISVVWNRMDIRKSLRAVRDSGLKYTPESVVSFYIYVLNIMKKHYLETILGKEMKNFEDTIQKKKDQFNEIIQDETTMSDLEKLEMEIINNTDTRETRKKELDQDFKDMLENDETRDEMTNIVEDKIENEVIETLVDKMKQNGETTEANKLEELEKKRMEIKNKEDRLKDEMNAALEAKKRKISSRFKNLVRKAIVENKKNKAQMEKKKTELQEISQMKNKTKKKIEKFNPSSKVHVNDLNQTNDPHFQSKPVDAVENLNKIILDSQQKNKMLTGTKMEDESSQNNSSGISDYNDDESSSLSDEDEDSFNMNQQLLDVTDERIEHLNNEQMIINGIRIDFKDNTSLNDSLVEDFENEVKAKHDDNLDLMNTSEDSVIMLDKKNAIMNNENILQHNMKAYVLDEASLKMQEREVAKLGQVQIIYNLRDQLQALEDQSVEKSDPRVVGLVKQIEEKVNELINQFGEAESLVENDNSLTHYTLGDLRDDLTVGELDYIKKLPLLQTNLKINNMIL